MTVVDMRSATDRALEQRREALEAGNVIRMKRAGLKRELQLGAKLSSVLAVSPEWLATMKVLDLLGAQRQWGMGKATKTMWRLDIWQGKRVGGLTERQRLMLVDELESLGR
jgi:hypothetical protein